MNTHLLILEDVTFTYSDDAPPVLDGVNLSVSPGDSLAIVGPSGCGKSTLLNLIGTLDTPKSGRIQLREYDLTDPAANRISFATIRSTQLGFIFQDHHLLPQCTLLENVMIPTLARDKHDKDAEEHATQLLRRVGLADRLHHRPGEVSGGQRQRAAVVRSLINHPSLILADEPTGSLDQHSADQLADLLVELNNEQGVTLMVVTHSAELAKRMKRVYRISRGKLVETSD